jgi:beta-glucosidase
LILGYDVIHGYCTILPVPLATASSFDPALIERSERIAAKEATAKPVHAPRSTYRANSRSCWRR